MSGLGSELSQVHWKQQWLENGTLFFHVSMSSAEQLHQATEAPARQPAHIPNEHAHLLHVSVMVSFKPHPPTSLAHGSELLSALKWEEMGCVGGDLSDQRYKVFIFLEKRDCATVRTNIKDKVKL
ncbi:hypothetical protein Z043_114958 [Scleropages formosus]|uniref:Astrotactin-1/2 N-terminal domain-containing protein n=1 Tax=Scleropages formosus TaxID=113540 RepID=A0A0P7UEZ6_SCLFO|nr:hypothetical protein Z043_114958 [Scleropages formosus]